MADEPREPRRTTPQQQQEARSRKQLGDRLIEYGWSSNAFEWDYGEDEFIQIQENGISTGLTFMAQVKSTSSLESLRLKTDPERLAYVLEKKDLVHWAKFTDPVVLVIWDINTRSGVWEMVPILLKQLDASNPGWRETDSPTVHLLAKNRTDDAGLRRLRYAVADSRLPLVKEPLRFSLRTSFPNTPEGIAAREALDRALHGEHPTVLDGQFIEALKYEGWMGRAYGQPEKPQFIQITPKLSKKTRLPVRLELDHEGGTIAVPHVGLRQVKARKNEALLTNEHERGPLQFELLITGPTAEETIGVDLRYFQARPGRTVHEESEAVAFLLASRRGGQLRVIGHKSGQLFFSVPLPARPSSKEDEIFQRRARFLETLRFLQQKVAKLGVFSLAKGVTEDDVQGALRLFAFLRDGKATVVGTFSFKITSVEELMIAPDGQLRFDLGRRSLKLFGLQVPLGRGYLEVAHPDEFLEKIRRRTARRKGKKPIKITFKKLEAVEVFPDLATELDGSQIASATTREEPPDSPP